MQPTIEQSLQNAVEQLNLFYSNCQRALCLTQPQKPFPKTEDFEKFLASANALCRPHLAALQESIQEVLYFRWSQYQESIRASSGEQSPEDALQALTRIPGDSPEYNSMLETFDAQNLGHMQDIPPSLLSNPSSSVPLSSQSLRPITTGSTPHEQLAVAPTNRTPIINHHHRHSGIAAGPYSRPCSAPCCVRPRQRRISPNTQQHQQSGNPVSSSPDVGTAVSNSFYSNPERLPATGAQNYGNCHACSNILVDSWGFMVYPCRHKYCLPCVRVMAKSAIESEANYPMKCCDVLVTFSGLQAVTVGSALLERVRVRGLEYSATQRVYCSNLECKRFICQDYFYGNHAMCQRCRTRTCRDCGEVGHIGACLVKEEDQTTAPAVPMAAIPMEQPLVSWDLTITEDSQICFQCSNTVVSTTGEILMRCDCGAVLCSKCGSPTPDCEHTQSWATLLGNIPDPLQQEPRRR